MNGARLDPRPVSPPPPQCTEYSIVRGMARCPMELSHGQIEEGLSVGHSREPSGREMLLRSLVGI
jgi:hypothetical protein